MGWLLAVSVVWGSQTPVLETETVRRDLLVHCASPRPAHDPLADSWICPIPREDLEGLEPALFAAFDLDSFRLVHLPYLPRQGVPTAESIVAVYRKGDSGWKYDGFLSYYRDLLLLDRAHRTFLSDGTRCDPDNVCTDHLELAEFADSGMVLRAEYRGGDRGPHLAGRLIEGLPNDGETPTPEQKASFREVRQAVGDTIVRSHKISEIRYNKFGLQAYDLATDIGILRSIEGDSLRIETSHQSRHVFLSRPAQAKLEWSTRIRRPVE